MDAANLDATAASAAGAQTAPAAASAAPSHTGISFHDVLSALNPLQYLPVVGTIYRAMTGDVVAEPLRVIGSLVASGLTGGPIGMLINLGVTAVEKLAGIDPDEVAHRVMAAVGLVGSDPAPAAAPAAPGAAPIQVAHVWNYPAEPAAQAEPVAPAAPVAQITEAGDPSDQARMRQATDAYGKAQSLAA